MLLEILGYKLGWKLNNIFKCWTEYFKKIITSFSLRMCAYFEPEANRQTGTCGR